MKVLPNSAVSYLLAIFVFANNSFCLAANQQPSNTVPDIHPPDTVTPRPRDELNRNSSADIAQTMPQKKFALSAVAYDTAQQLDIVPLIEQLQVLQNEPSSDAIEIKKLQLKQRLTNSILIATLQVRDVTARIEWESSRLNRMLEYLEDRRDKALKINTISNAIGMGAMMTTGQAMELSRNEEIGRAHV
jgi:hypothetical protein